DQSSPLPATAAADLVLERQKQKPPHRFAAIDGSHHINFRIVDKPGITAFLNSAAFARTNFAKLFLSFAVGGTSNSITANGE
ncbi:MAG: hypothetical protein WA400_12175, partial [Silvibacterium sp.]